MNSKARAVREPARVAGSCPRCTEPGRPCLLRRSSRCSRGCCSPGRPSSRPGTRSGRRTASRSSATPSRATRSPRSSSRTAATFTRCRCGRGGRRGSPARPRGGRLLHRVARRRPARRFRVRGQRRDPALARTPPRARRAHGAAAGGRIRAAREYGEPPLLPRLRVLLGVRLAKDDQNSAGRARYGGRRHGTERSAHAFVRPACPLERRVAAWPPRSSSRRPFRRPRRPARRHVVAWESRPSGSRASTRWISRCSSPSA